MIGSGGKVLNPNSHFADGKREWETDRGIAGVELTKYARSLTAIDPPSEQVAAIAAERTDTEQQERRERGERAEREAQRSRERKRFGVTLNDAPGE